ncbi:MAG: GNAT family N-acetyltransferase [Verrucomicrobiales bacterium]|nr:GNAT family N-acetyltransferase [Verrucomicrobiales bacterium]
MPVTRVASESDKKYAFRLYNTLFRPHIETIWGWDDRWQITNFESEWQQFDTEIVEHNGIGIGYLQTEYRSDPLHLYLSIIALDSAYQGKGLGSSIMRGLTSRVEKQDIPLRLNVFRINPEARRFYERLGFREVSTTESGVILEWYGKF